MAPDLDSGSHCRLELRVYLGVLFERGEAGRGRYEQEFPISGPLDTAAGQPGGMYEPGRVQVASCRLFRRTDGDLKCVSRGMPSCHATAVSPSDTRSHICAVAFAQRSVRGPLMASGSELIRLNTKLPMPKRRVRDFGTNMHYLTSPLPSGNYAGKSTTC